MRDSSGVLSLVRIFLRVSSNSGLGFVFVVDGVWFIVMENGIFCESVKMVLSGI